GKGSFSLEQQNGRDAARCWPIITTDSTGRKGSGNHDKSRECEPVPIHGLCANRHRFGIPVAHPLLEVTGVGQQRRAGRPKTEYSIFHRLLTAAHGFIENAVMLLVGVISGWWREPLR